MSGLIVQPNEHGVYPDQELLWLPHEKKGWQGIPRAEIALARCEDGWRAAHSYAFFTGSHLGSFRPIKASNPVHSSREAALADEIDAFCRNVAGVQGEASMLPEAQEMLAWAEGLIPAQGDLFLAEPGRAAA